METIEIDKDIKIFYVTARSFPDGILDAHNELHKLVPFSVERKYFGLSRPENNGEIVYKAATEETFPGEAEKYKCKTLVIKRGKYISLAVKDFRKDPLSISQAFQELLHQPNIDPQGYCVEWYSNSGEVVHCMIRLDA